MAMVWEDWPLPGVSDGFVLLWCGGRPLLASAAPAANFDDEGNLTGEAADRCLLTANGRVVRQDTIDKAARIEPPELPPVKPTVTSVARALKRVDVVEELPDNWLSDAGLVKLMVTYCIEQAQKVPEHQHQYIGIAMPMAAGLWWFCVDHRDDHAAVGDLNLADYIDASPYLPADDEVGPPPGGAQHVYDLLVSGLSGGRG